MSASEGQKIASMTVATLETLRDDGQFDLLWKKVEIHALSLDVESPKLPRKRKVPLRYAEGTLEPVGFYLGGSPQIWGRPPQIDKFGIIFGGVSPFFGGTPPFI